jgi:diguanylate cyclase (GGDEF)-like protein
VSPTSTAPWPARRRATAGATRVAAWVLGRVAALGLGFGLLIASAAVPARAADDAAALLDRAEAAVRIDPEAVRRLAEQALAALQPSPDVDLQVRAELLLCEHEAERDRVRAQQWLAAARARLPQARAGAAAARADACEGEILENAGDGAGALVLYERAVAGAEQAGDRAQLAQALYLRGYLRGVRGEYANGLSDLKRAAALYDGLDMPAHRTTVHNGLAILYNRMGDAEQARLFYETALRQQQALGLERELVVTWHNLGRVLENLGDWGAAETAFAQTLALAQRLAYSRGQAHALRGLAAVENARGRHAQALALLDDSAATQRGLPDERLRGQIQLQRGIALAALARPAEARAALDEAMAVFARAESPAEVGRTHEALARLHAGQGDWSDAYRALADFKRVSDELLRRQIGQRFAVLKLETDAAARELELRLLQREREATSYALTQERLAGRLRTVSLVLGGVLAAVLAVLAWRLRRTGLAMRRLAHTDELTGLPNRRDVLARMDRLRAAGRGVALLIVDLDHFKRINDGHGHDAGDAVLRGAAGVLRELAQPPVAAGRLGGEEFVLVAPDTDAAAATALAERLRAAIEGMQPEIDGGRLRVTTSIGVAVGRTDESSQALLRRADLALYAAKDGGRNRVVLAAD